MRISFSVRSISLPLLTRVFRLNSPSSFFCSAIAATISYSDSNTRKEPTTLVTEDLPFFNDLLMSPLAVSAQAPADVSLDMTFAFDTYDNGMNRAAFNDV